MRQSSFPFIVNDPTTGLDVYLCASADGQWANFSYTPCPKPYMMTCQLGGAFSMAGDTPLSIMAERNDLEIPAEYWPCPSHPTRPPPRTHPPAPL